MGGTDSSTRATSGGSAEMCQLRLTREPMAGWLLEGSCGERLLFGANVVLKAVDIPASACEQFRAEALRAFGPRGLRRLTEKPEEAFDGFGGLGRRPVPQRQGGF